MAAAAGAGGGHTSGRASKLARAHAAGRAAPSGSAPAWIDDSASQNAFLQGQADATDAELGGAPAAPASSVPKQRAKPKPGTTPTPAPSSTPSAPPTPPPAPSRWDGAPTFATPGAVPSGDIAGGIVGLLAVAFMINVLKGTWQQWLKAKFLNEVDGSTRSDPNNAPGLFSASGDAISAANGAAGTPSSTPVPFAPGASLPLTQTLVVPSSNPVPYAPGVSLPLTALSGG